MLVLYDYKLVVLSVTVAILGAHAGMLLLAKNDEKAHLPFKVRVGGGALVIGGGVWTMHFIGMLALHLSLPSQIGASPAINYTVLPTLISALIIIVLTGLGLYVTMSGYFPRWGHIIGAILMGLGISSMHYVGMEAIKSVCRVTYSPNGVLMAVGLGIGVSWLALKLATSTSRGKRQTLASAVVLGLAISSMHYVAMLHTQFEFLDNVVIVQLPALDNTFLACIVAVLTFLLLNAFLFLALPNGKNRSENSPTLGENLADGATPQAVLQPETNSQQPNASQTSVAATWSNLGDTLAVPGASTTSLDDAIAAPASQTGDLPDHTTPPPDSQNRVSVGVLVNGVLQYINASDILFVSADGHYTQIGYLNEAKIFNQQMCNRQLSDLAQVLEPLGIMRVHRSHLANIRHVSGFRKKGERGQIIFQTRNTPSIPISRSQLHEFSDSVAKLCGSV